jgi:flavorubredoxin
MDLPVRAVENHLVAPDTHVVRQLFGEGVAPVAVYVNSVVITGSEPVLVDVGPAITRDLWFEHAFSAVDPADVRWIFLSHDDGDHTGNLPEVLEVCPDATVVTTQFMGDRLADRIVLPMDRVRWVNDGEHFQAGDRRLVAMAPPTFDNPTTRGLFDASTGVYWASDSFSAPVPGEMATAAELDPDFFREGFLQFQQMLAPWLQWTDPARYQARIDRVADLGARAVVSAHGPVVDGEQLALAFELFAAGPHQPALVPPGQAELEAELEAMLATLAAPAEVAA